MGAFATTVDDGGVERVITVVVALPSGFGTHFDEFGDSAKGVAAARIVEGRPGVVIETPVCF